MEDQQMLLNTEQSPQPFLYLVCWGVYYIARASKWQLYGIHALTIYLFIPLRAAQILDLCAVGTHLKRDLDKGTAGPRQKGI